jgi:hypothetical protein
MNGDPIPAPADTSSSFVVTLDYQTGMPPVYPSRSKELAYDSLIYESRFIYNPFGPQQLNLTRPNHRW